VSPAPGTLSREPEIGAASPGAVAVRGACYVVFAFDIGLSVNLETAERLIREAATRGTPEREAIRHKRRTPRYFEYRPRPLRLVQPAAPVTVAGFTGTGRAECVLWDFGAVSVTFTLPLNTELESLLALSDALYENAALIEAARTRVNDLLQVVRPAVDKPHVAELVEDYCIYQFEGVEGPGATPLPAPAVVDAAGRRAAVPVPPLDTGALIGTHRQLLAQVLRSEPQTLSAQEVDDALQSRIAYAPGEEAVIDWNAAVLFSRDAEDVRAVLEYANVELLELRRLDDQLDDVLDRSYVELSRRGWERSIRLTPGRELRRIAELQMDSALLFEGVNNALKLIGDQYLARVYKLAADRMHLPDWDASILRKLQTAESIYQKLTDQQSARRMEVLEWIIILLIAFEILMSLFRI
jgi:hypothetical protein